MFKTKSAATRAGKLALKTLARWPGWKLRVWENLGWRYSINNVEDGASVSVIPTNGGFQALIGKSECCGCMQWRNIVEIGISPPNAVAIALRAVKRSVYYDFKIMNHTLRSLGLKERSIR